MQSRQHKMVVNDRRIMLARSMGYVSRKKPLPGAIAKYLFNTGITSSQGLVSAWADQSGNANNLLQATDTNKPYYLDYSGTKYLWLPGIAGNNASASDSAPLSITGDISLYSDALLHNWSAAARQGIIGKFQTGQKSYIMAIGSNRQLTLFWTTDGSTEIAQQATVNLPDIADNRLQLLITLDVDNDAGGYAVKFFTVSAGGAWSQLGTTITGASTTSIFDGTGSLVLGGPMNLSSSGETAGKIFSSKVYSGLVTVSGGVLDTSAATLAFDANFANQTEAATSFTEDSANAATVTINSTGGWKAQIVGPITGNALLFDGVDNWMRTGVFTINQPCTIYTVFEIVTWGSNDHIFYLTGDGTAATPLLKMRAGGSAPQLSQVSLAAADGPTVGSYGIYTAVYNSTSSLTQLNNGAAVTGDAGANNGNGFMIGAYSDATSEFSNIAVKEIIIYNVAHGAPQRLYIRDYAREKFSL